jgi:hypothetical protein
MNNFSLVPHYGDEGMSVKTKSTCWLGSTARGGGRGGGTDEEGDAGIGCDVGDANAELVAAFAPTCCSSSCAGFFSGGGGAGLFGGGGGGGLWAGIASDDDAPSPPRWRSFTPSTVSLVGPKWRDTTRLSSIMAASSILLRRRVLVPGACGPSCSAATTRDSSSTAPPSPLLWEVEEGGGSGRDHCVFPMALLP